MGLPLEVDGARTCVVYRLLMHVRLPARATSRYANPMPSPPHRARPIIPDIDARTRPRPLRVVLDTNACLDLLVFTSARSAPLADLLRAGTLRAVTRADCRDEFLRVLRYPGLALDEARCLALTSAYDALASECEVCVDVSARLPRCRDPDDQKFLELARDAGAIALITRDAELLVLAGRTARAGLFNILQPADVTADQVARWNGSALGDDDCLIAMVSS